MKGFFPGFLKGMKDFGHKISVIVNTALLAIVYIFGVGLTSVISKLFGKKFLEMKLDKENKEKSYWSDLNLKKQDKDEYYRQF